eukprot:11179528-Lingulodinium_polyedra.AAC.1
MAIAWPLHGQQLARAWPVRGMFCGLRMASVFRCLTYFFTPGRMPRAFPAIAGHAPKLYSGTRHPRRDPTPR